MSVLPSDNDLKKYRKRSGLTQSELGFLLGHKSAAKVSRYEKKHSTPNLKTTFACASVFGIMSESLFVGIQRKSEIAVGQRMKELVAILENRSQERKSGNDNRKVTWLVERLRQIQNEHSA